MKTKKKVKKRTLKSLRLELWSLCKEIVRKRDGDECFICNRTGLVGSNWHTGHFIPSSVCGGFLRYDLRNLHSSCYYCNINLGGNGAEYYRKMVSRYGQAFVDLLFIQKNHMIKLDQSFYERKIQEYKEVSSWDKARILDYTKSTS